MVAKKGRPLSENVKDTMLRVRLDKDTVEKLNFLTEKLNESKSEIVRQGINERYEKEK